MNPRDRLLSAGRLVTDPAEALAQQVTERVVDLVVGALDLNELAARVDVNAILSRVDVDAVLKKVDLNAVLDQVDVNALAQRLDVAALVEEADLGRVIARSSGGIAREALDAGRTQAARLDQIIDRRMRQLFRRKKPAPPALVVPARARS